MSEKQPKLKFEEEKERTATRSPPKKSKVEQSVPKKQKLKQDADKAAEKSQHLRFGKAEITPDTYTQEAFHQFRLPISKGETIMAKGSVRKKGKKWYYRFYVEDASGNLVQKEFAGTESKSETEKMLRKAMEDYDAKKFLAKADNLTLGQMLDVWAEEDLKTGNVFHICQFAEVMERNHADFYPEIQTQDEQTAWELGGKGYLAIQSCEDGWDYTLYHSDYSVMDGGQLDAPELTIQEAREQILEAHHMEKGRRLLQDYDAVMDKVAEAEELSADHRPSTLEKLAELASDTSAPKSSARSAPEL